MNGQTPTATGRIALDITSGWLQGVRRVPSPNCDQRPAGTGIELLVIHGISLPPGEFGGEAVDALFTNTLDPQGHPYYREIAGLRVSAHLLIDRDGAITQYVSLHDRAWHAGVSCFRGREACNDFSIGIELEGCDELPYTDAQYQRLASITCLLQRHFPLLDGENIVGHCDIAPGRKTDPGPVFDWNHYRMLIKQTEPMPEY